MASEKTQLTRFTSDIGPESSEALNAMLAEVLSRGGIVSLSTIGTSMRPLITAGFTVRVHGCPLSKMKFGDIVLLRKHTKYGKFLIHRIIKIKRTSEGIKVYTKGDSSPSDLQLFNEETCLGKVKNIITEAEEFNLEKWIWRPINITAALLSKFSAIFVDGLPFFPKKDPRRLILPQRLALSLLKRLVYVGNWASRTKPSLPGVS